MKRIHLLVVCIGACLTFISRHAGSAEPDATERALARMFVSLEARNLNGYCDSRRDAAYGAYLRRACESAVQNKVKTELDCTLQKLMQQVNVDIAQCLAMLPQDFERTVNLGEDGRKSFLADMQSRGVDVAKLLQEERAKSR